MNELQRLGAENLRLSDEIKRLVKTERQLYEIQEHLDGQMRTYRQLYEIGKKLNATLDLATILQMAAQFVVYDLNFQRTLVLMRQTETACFSVEAMDGYYDDAESGDIARLTLPASSPALAPLYNGVERVLCPPDCRSGELRSLRRLLGMDEYVILPMGGEPNNPVGLLAAGNAAERAHYHSRVVQEGEAMLGLANLASQTSTAINNARFYQALARERQSLEENVRERTRDLVETLRDLKAAQASLIQAEKMASLGQLTAGIAHEIKNPLNFVNNFATLSVELLGELKAVVGSATTVLDADRGAEVGEVIDMLSGNLERIAEHGRRADGIVKSMLEHSRGVTGERRKVDFNDLIDEALNLAYHGARAQDASFNVTLERAFDPAIAPIELAPQEMTRALLNLFGNGFYAAAKRQRDDAEPNFRPMLRVATRDLPDAVEVRIRDNGVGIEPAIRDKLFQPFFTTKPTGEGTGLGLSISYDIVTQQHGGMIEVDSRVGEFTEFTISLPRQWRAAEAGTAA